MPIDLQKLLRPYRLDAWATLHERPEEAVKEGLALLKHARSGPGRQPANAKCWAVFLALVRAKARLPASFEGLLPVPTQRGELAEARACLEAVPEARRDAALVHSLLRVDSTTAVKGGLLWLSIRPNLELARIVFRRSAESEIMPRAKVKPLLTRLATRHPELTPALTGR